MRVLFVHGRAQGGRNEAEVRQEWLAALEDGFKATGRTWPTDIPFDFPFYGDELDGFVESFDLRDPEDVAAKGPGRQPAFERFMQEVLTEIQQSNPRLSEGAIRAEYPGDSIGAKGAENWKWVHAIARFIDKRWSGAADFTIEKFLKDVHIYVNSRYVSNQINQIVFKKITAEPTVVVGHSLGSVVSYNVIKAQSGSLDVVKHVTVGSPLGLKAIGSKLGIPVNLAGDGWFNAFDPNDIVALNPLDATHFGTNPAIENHGGVANQTSNQHGIAGYLNDPRVANVIADAIAGVG